MTNILSPSPVAKFFDNNGQPLAGGRVFTYAAGTTNKLGTFKTSSGTDNDNPIILNARGECDLWIPPNVAYKYTVAPPGIDDPPSVVIDTIDNIVASQLITLYGGVDSGAANTYVLTFSANFSSYTDGTVIYWVPAHTNTGPSTLNINGIGPANIIYPDGTALFGGELVAGQAAEIIVSGGQFLLLSAVYQIGSFTPSWGGFSVAPTGAMLWQKIGSQVTLKWTGTTGTSGGGSATTMTIGNVPNAIKPSGGSVVGMMSVVVIDNNTRVLGSMGFGGSSTFQFNMGSPLSGTGFTGTGTKGLDAGWTATYSR